MGCSIVCLYIFYLNSCPSFILSCVDLLEKRLNNIYLLSSQNCRFTFVLFIYRMKSNMLRYNFRPSLVDHGQMLILVRQFYNCSDRDHAFVLKKLGVFTHALIEGSNRQMLLRFTKGYSRDVLEWGRIQIHRRPLGFIGVACLSTDPTQQGKDYEKITHRFDNLISQYEAFLFDSRCIIVGPENPDIKIDRNDVIYMSTADAEISNAFVSSITDFVSSLFVILESKRIEKQSENFDRMLLPVAPCEQEQTSIDLDSRYPRFSLFLVKYSIIYCNKRFLWNIQKF